MSRYDAEGLEPGSWGEFFAALEHMTTRMQSSKFNSYELAVSLVAPLQANVIAQYNTAMTKLVSHTTNYTNAHDIDRDVLQLGLVDNVAVATLEQIADGGYGDLYITADGFSALAAKVFGDFGTVLHHQGINPISVYGDVSWLPPDVSGSFEGSGQANAGNAGSFSLIEDDGTLIGLRRGTNGTSQGLYYYYQSNAEDKIDAVGPVRMNLRYSPANRPAGFECLDTISSDVGCIVGIGFGHATYNGFVSLTNGTMDVSKHYTGYFNVATAFGDIPAYDTFSSACVVGNYVYIFIPMIAASWNYSGEVPDPYDFKVFRCPTSQIVAGGAVTWEAITSWNSTGLWGNTGVTPNIRITPSIISKTAANKPFILHENRSWTTTYSPVHSGRRTMCCVNPANPAQVRLVVYHTIWTSLANGTAVMPNMAFSMLINVTAKTAVAEDGASYIKHVSPNQNSVSLVSTSIMDDATKVTGFNYAGNWHPNTLVTARGYMLSRGSGNQPDENSRFLRAQITNFVNRYDALRMRNRVVRAINNAPDTIRVGSDFTNGSMNPRMLPGLYLMYNGTATSGSNQFSYGRAKRLQFIGSPTFNYGTINSGVLKGWAPNSTRVEFTTNITFNQAVFISRAASDGSLVADASVAYGPTTIVSSGTAINKDLTISGNFTWSATEGNNMAITIARQVLAKTTLYQYAWTMYVPQDTNMPVLMVISASTARDDAVGFRSCNILAELNYTGARSGNVTGYSLKRVVDSVIYDPMPGGAYLQYETMGGIQSYKCADGTYLMSIGCPPVLGTYGGQQGVIWYAAVRAGAKTLEDATVKRFNHGYYPTSANPSGFVHPSYGLCKMDYATNQANYNAILAVDVMANTYADYTAWVSKAKYVVGAQEVEQGWIVYFTADAPVFLAGREYTLPATSIDLRTINASPGNKTFYCYVRLTTAGIEYFITTDALAPTMTMMYIGKIVTITTQISTIEITKKIRVDTFELSPTHIGSGIPTGVGVPSQVGDFKGWTT
ncbi:hypothetical protein pEaSNUABM37_00021 [Erwinia phage pEa_SNUABM_37]|nr:hypothetical protein pEaSNUABM37_00021 [Erwinia phage pEa_SNUABM_37]QXO10491.1 hypothetical protein pEaSNUABM48_00021 [Erwinia phage pEa_SNUABM_48]